MDTRVFEKAVEQFDIDSKQTRLENELYRVEIEKEKTDSHERYRVRDVEFQERHGRLVYAETEVAREQNKLAHEHRENVAKAAELSDRESELYKRETNLYTIYEYLKSHI